MATNRLVPNGATSTGASARPDIYPAGAWTGDDGYRLVALLLADACGYSRAMARDEAGTHAVLLAHRRFMCAVVAEYGGRPVSSAGDDLLAEFSSVLAALRAAVALQSGLHERNRVLPPESRLHFRVGVHSGDVLEVDGALFGHSVNVTARLQGLAAPGGVAVSAAVHEQAKGRVPLRFRDGGFRRVKNLPDRLRVYHAVPAGAAVGRLPSRLVAIGGWLGPALVTAVVVAAASFAVLLP